MGDTLRILTFNFHEPYLWLMAKTGLGFEVGLYSQGPLARAWHTHHRPVPTNLNLVPEAEWRAKIQSGYYDLLIAHNEMNALDIRHADCPKILVCHNRRTFLETTMGKTPAEAHAAMQEILETLQESSFHFVFISESKRKSYGIDGDVILPGIDPAEYGDYTGAIPAVLRVGNLMRERDLMFDVSLQEAACSGLPYRIVGLNPTLAYSSPAQSWNELKDLYRQYRVYLHVTREEYEDGYNLALLEAMATGMPIVTFKNATSPITHGEDGLVGENAAQLRAFLQSLLEDATTAKSLGQRARRTVEEKFPLAAFTDAWKCTIEQCARKRVHRMSSHAPSSPKQPRMLLHYVAAPFTTGRYLEEAFRSLTEVRTIGPRLPEALLEEWGFPAPFPHYAEHDVPMSWGESLASIQEKLPSDFIPDIYFRVDCGETTADPGLTELPFPKAVYLIDTHVQLLPRIALARAYDIVFIAQKGQLAAFHQAGVTQARWVPLGCSPSLHNVPETTRELDFAYVGSLNPAEGDVRWRVLGPLVQRFPNHFVGRAFPRDMAAIYARAKIVVNVSFRRDVNMRVFEALASGALLITDEADGLTDLFEVGKHLVVYRSPEEALEYVSYYLENEEERRAVAEAGRRHVLAHHTYTHRAQAMLEHIREHLQKTHAHESYGHKDSEYFRQARWELLPHVPLTARRILDVGCGAGRFGALLKEKRAGIEVVGIELMPEQAQHAAQHLDRVLVGNIETMPLPFAEGYFDCIVCADVLEHLRYPDRVLERLRPLLAPYGVLLISFPNIRFHEVLTMLSQGAWRYQNQGILDATHLRFFTKTELHSLLTGAGYACFSVEPLNAVPVVCIPHDGDMRVRLGLLSFPVNNEEEWRELATVQFLVKAGQPHVDRLAPAREALARNQNERALILAADAEGVDDAERFKIMAKAEAQLGNLTAALEHYEEVLKRCSASETRCEYAALLVAAKRPEEALHILADLEEEAAHTPLVRRVRGLAYAALGRHPEAVEELSAALRASKAHPDVALPLLQSALRLGRLEEVVPLIRDVYELCPANLELALGLSEAYLHIGDRTKARDVLEQVLLFYPDDPLVRKRWAEVAAL